MKKTSQRIFGIHALRHVLESDPSRVLEIWVQDRQDKRLSLLIDLAQDNGITIQQANRNSLDKLSDQGVHQGIVAACREAKGYDEDYLYQLIDKRLQQAKARPLLLLILDGVQDPHNLGACLRSADAAGADAVIIPKNRAASLSATVSKVASGAAERIPLVSVTNLARCLQQLQTQGVFLVGLADEVKQDFYQQDLNQAVGLVLGAEQNGLRRLSREHCDVLAALPMFGEISSLNVSVTAGICLYECVRQRL